MIQTQNLPTPDDADPDPDPDDPLGLTRNRKRGPSHLGNPQTHSLSFLSRGRLDLLPLIPTPSVSFLSLVPVTQMEHSSHVSLVLSSKATKPLVSTVT